MKHLAQWTLMSSLFVLMTWTFAAPVHGQAADETAAPASEQATAEEAKGPSDEERQASGRALIQKVVAAHGGEAFQQQTSQVSEGTGRLRPFGQAASTELDRVAVYKHWPDRDRIEMTLPQGEVVQVFDGVEGWLVNAGQTLDQTERLKNRRYFGYDVLRRFDDSFFAKQLDDETVGEVVYAVVEIRDAEEHATKVLIRKNAHTVFQVVYDPGDQEITERYSEYKPFDGVQVPTRIELYQANAKVLDFNVDSVQVNSKLDEALFQK